MELDQTSLTTVTESCSSFDSECSTVATADKNNVYENNNKKKQIKL